MIKQFENLSPEESALLLKAPVLLSVLVSCSYNTVNETQKNDAIKLAHLRTFTAPPLLLPYYGEVEKYFKAEFEKTVTLYFPFDEEKRAELKAEINKVNAITAKLDAHYAAVLQKSLESYSRHEKKSAYSVFRDFIFPITYSRLNEF
jgi:hypothetical protein